MELVPSDVLRITNTQLVLYVYMFICLYVYMFICLYAMHKRVRVLYRIAISSIWRQIRNITRRYWRSKRLVNFLNSSIPQFLNKPVSHSFYVELSCIVTVLFLDPSKFRNHYLDYIIFPLLESFACSLWGSY